MSERHVNKLLFRIFLIDVFFYWEKSSTHHRHTWVWQFDGDYELKNLFPTEYHQGVRDLWIDYMNFCDENGNIGKAKEFQRDEKNKMQLEKINSLINVTMNVSKRILSDHKYILNS